MFWCDLQNLLVTNYPTRIYHNMNKYFHESEFLGLNFAFPFFYILFSFLIL